MGIFQTKSRSEKVRPPMITFVVNWQVGRLRAGKLANDLLPCHVEDTLRDLQEVADYVKYEMPYKTVFKIGIDEAEDFGKYAEELSKQIKKTYPQLMFTRQSRQNSRWESFCGRILNHRIGSHGRPLYHLNSNIKLYESSLVAITEMCESRSDDKSQITYCRLRHYLELLELPIRSGSMDKIAPWTNLPDWFVTHKSAPMFRRAPFSLSGIRPIPLSQWVQLSRRNFPKSH